MSEQKQKQSNEVLVYFGKPRKGSGRKPIPPDLQAKARELVEAGVLTWDDVFGPENPGEDWVDRLKGEPLKRSD